MAAKVFGNFYPGISYNKKKRAALIEQHALLFRFVNFTILKNFFYSLSPFLLSSHHSFQSLDFIIRILHHI